MIKKVCKGLFVLFLVLNLGCESQNETLAPLVPKTIDVNKALKKGVFRVVVDASMVTARVIKNNEVPVMASFNVNSGVLDINEGKDLFNLRVDVSSFNSGLTIRDDNVVKTFFNISETPNKEAVFLVKEIAKEKVKELKKGKEIKEVSVNGVLKYRQKQTEVSALLKAFFNKYGRLVVETVKPFKVKISDLGLSENLKALLAVCNQKSIDDVVEVGVHLESKP